MILSNIKGIWNNFQLNENVTSYPKLMMFQLSGYSENRYTVYRSFALKNNNLEQYVSMLFLTKYKNILIVYGFCSPSHCNGVTYLKICQNFVVTKHFRTFVTGQTSVGEVKNIWGSNIYYHITTLSLFHFFRNSQHAEKGSISFKNFFVKCECISC